MKLVIRILWVYGLLLFGAGQSHLVADTSVLHDFENPYASYEAHRLSFLDEIGQVENHLTFLLEDFSQKKIYGKDISGFVQDALQPLAELVRENKNRYLVANSMIQLTESSANDPTIASAITNATSAASDALQQFSSALAAAGVYRDALKAMLKANSFSGYLLFKAQRMQKNV